MQQTQPFTESPDGASRPSPKKGYSIHHAVIIAAGSGMRFGKATQFRPKPLIDVAGVPLILRTILTARKAGIDHFTVVTGYRAEVIEDFLRREVPGDIFVQCVRNDKWQLPNGLSVLRAKGCAPERFVLLMSDHLFDADILKKLLADPLIPGHCRLAVDFRTENIVDLEDATKVLVEAGKLTDIGKEITCYNAIDTGIFLCSHALFDALEASASQGRESLSDGIRELIRNQCMEATDVSSLFWQDIDTARDLKEGKKRLLKTLISKKDNWITRNINRRISLLVTAQLAKTSIRPNHITLFNFALGIIAVICMLPGTYLASLMGVSLFLVASILDGCDGEIARLKFQQTHFGAWLDTTTDNAVYIALFICMTIGQVNATGSTLYFLPGGFLVSGSLASFALAVAGHQRLNQWRGPVFSESRLQDVLLTSSQEKLAVWIDRMANRDFAYLLVFLALIDRLHWFLWMAGIGAPVFAFLIHRVLVHDRLQEA